MDWPLNVVALFDWVRLFSFSINVVRPECAFSWKFQTKVIVTLLTPISLSLLTLLCGFIYGMIVCFNMFKKLQKERRETGKYVKISYSSVLNCWYVFVSGLYLLLQYDSVQQDTHRSVPKCEI